MAGHAAGAFSDSQEISQLNHASVTRDVIGQGKGIPLQRFEISAQRAFQILTGQAPNPTIKLWFVVEHRTHAAE